MRKHMLRASAALALLVWACGGTSPAAGPAATPARACVSAGAAHRAYVVVEHLSGAVVQRCVGFDGAEIGGEDLMRQSGIEYQAQTFSGLGKAVCQVDGEPARFTECFPKDQPYWALLVSVHGGAWADAQTGYTSVTLNDGDAMGWQYRPATASPAPPPLPTR